MSEEELIKIDIAISGIFTSYIYINLIKTKNK
jgi:hypothetical protein